MAEARFSQDELMCPVCLDLLKDPVSIQCGHSYCKSCITGCWDQEDQMRVYSCPQCRQTFSPRPALARNTMLTDLVEKLKKTKLPADCDAGAGDVQCDVCTGRKYKAVKSCLMCQESYCQTHFDRHEEFHSRKPHKVTEATGRLQEMICQKHEKLLEVFCRTDQKCICVLCTIDEHKNHDTVSAAAQRTEKQFEPTAAVEDSERIFTELIRSIESSRSELIRLIRDQEKTAVSRAEGRLERLEQEINDLRRRDAELEQFSHTQDHIQCLQILLVLLYNHYGRLTLDLNTVNKWLVLSESNTVITYTKTVQPYPDHPDRFDRWCQVLCRESVCGRCYWELEWSGRKVFITVSYKSISRKGLGDECVFGYNNQSWSLFCSSSSYSFSHNNIWTTLPVIEFPVSLSSS
uniref:Uncharacterized protein n=1 Tax=Sinocyclocheilus grahami TaxID=75366 RepID=A0A672MGR1_SINGR